MLVCAKAFLHDEPDLELTDSALFTVGSLMHDFEEAAMDTNSPARCRQLTERLQEIAKLMAAAHGTVWARWQQLTQESL
jgi:hypothetical protein